MPESLGIRIPNFGIPNALPEVNFPEYRSDVKTSRSLVIVQPAGSIFDTRLCVNTDYVLTPVEITVMFNTSVALVFGDTVEIYLPTFSAPSDPNLFGTGLLYGAPRLGCDIPEEEKTVFFPPPIAVWDEDRKTLSFLVATDVPAFTYVHFVLSEFLEIGELGLRKPNDPDYLINLITEIPVGTSRIEISPGAGAFMYSALNYSPRLSNEDVDVHFEFQYSQNMQAGEYIIFELPGFNSGQEPGDGSADAMTFSTGGANRQSFPRGIWYPSHEPPQVKFISSETITRGRLIQLTIPRPVGLHIPAQGLVEASDLNGFKITTNANAGPVPPITIHRLANVGSFSRSEVLELSSRTAGAMTEISLSFTSDREIETGAFMEVLMRGWTRHDNSNTKLYVRGQQEADDGGQLLGLIEDDTLLWYPDKEVLRMYFAYPVLPGRKVTLTLPVSHGFRIPLGGLTPTESYDPTCRCGSEWTACDCADLIYRLESRTPIDPRPITVVPGIGIFLYTSLAFDPPAAPYRKDQSLAVALWFAFQVNGLLLPDDAIRFKLPNITRTNSIPLEVSGRDSHALKNPEWNADQETLSVIVATALPPKTMVLFNFSTSAGFQVAFEGMARDEPLVTASSISARTGILPVSVQQTTPVGSFLGSTVWRFYPKHAGKRCTVYFSFTAAMPFKASDVLEIELPGLTAPTSTNISVVSTVSGRSEIRVEEFLVGHRVQVRKGDGWEDATVLGNHVTEISVRLTSTYLMKTVPIQDVRHYRLIHNASWTQESQLLVLTFTSTLPRRTPLEIAINQYGFGGFLIPEDGIAGKATSRNIPKADYGWITEGMSPFSIATNAVDGPVLPMPIERVEAIIAFANTSFSFSPTTVAGEPGTVIFVFSVSEELGNGDEIYISLPSFKGQCLIPPSVNFDPCPQADDHRIPSVLYDVFSVELRLDPNYPYESRGLKRNVDMFWSDRDHSFRMLVKERIRTYEELRMEVRSGRVASGGFNVIVPEAGVRCQDTGLRPNCRYVNAADRQLKQPWLTLSSIALKGRVDTLQIMDVQPLGSFNPPFEISFAPATRGMVTNLKMRFIPTMDIATGERIVVSLPGFKRDENVVGQNFIRNQDTTVETESPASFALFWNGDRSEITMQLTSGNITAGQETSITVNTPAGILIPADGVTRDSILTVSSDAHDGTIYHQMMTFPAVGSLGGNLGIGFYPTQAGERTAVAFRFRPVMGMRAGESCLLKLPHFSRYNGTGFIYSGQRFAGLTAGHSSTDGDRTEAIFSLTWESEPPREPDIPAVRITAIEATSDFHEVTISEINEIRLPADGVTAVSDMVTVSCNLSSGIIPETPIIPDYYIGIFPPGSSIAFHPASAGQPTQMAIKIVYSADIKPGDTFSWLLPGFFSISNEEPELAGDDFAKFKAKWLAEDEALELNAIGSLSRGHVVHLTVKAFRGLSLPRSGIRETGHGIKVGTDALGGRVLPPVPVNIVQVVGAFETSHLEFEPPQAGMPASITFTFSPYMNIRGGETIELSLRGFEAVDLTARNGTTGLLTYNPAVVQVQRAGEESLTVIRYIVPEPGVLAGEHMTITIADPDALIKLPFDGVLLGHSSLTITCDAVDGPVEAEAIRTWQLVGSFTDSARLDFPVTQEASTALMMQMTFTPKMRIDVNETVTFHLPGFTGPMQRIGLLTSPPMSAPEAVWYPSSEELVVRASKVFVPNVPIVLKLLESTLLLPQDGVKEGDNVYTISSNAAAGPVLPTPVMISKIGIIYDSQLQFGNPRAGEPSSLTIEFRLRTPVIPGDKVQVGLPGFVLPDTRQKRFYTESANWAQAEWVYLPPTNTPALNLIASQTATGSTFRVVVPSSAGIQLPRDGVKLNQPSLFIRSFAYAESAVSTPFIGVQAVGSFTNTTKIVFDDLLQTYAGRSMEFTISFVPEMRLDEGDHVRIYLPKFVFLNDTELVYNLDGRFDAVDGFADSTITLRAVRTLPSRQQLDVKVRGLAVPVEGIRLGQDEIRISTDAKNGPVLPIKIHEVPVIGALMHSSLAFGNREAGQITSVQFVIRPFMQLGCSAEQLQSNDCSGVTSRIQIHLPEFSRQKPGPFPDCGGLDDCSWNEDSQLLTAESTKYVPAGAELTFTIPQSGKLVLPASGVLSDDDRYKVSVVSGYGNVVPTSIVTTMGVGSFQESAIRFFRGSSDVKSSAVANMSTAMEIEFKYVFTKVLKNDEIRVVLPGVLSDNGANFQLSVDWKSSFVWDTFDLPLEELKATASWAVSTDGEGNPVGGVLVLTAPRDLELFATSTVTIEMTHGFRLPLSGNPPNNPEFVISTDKIVGPVPPIPVETSTAVGAFFASKIAFDAGRADSITAVSVTLAPAMRLSYNDVITITLPGFRGPDEQWTQSPTSTQNVTIQVDSCPACGVQPSSRISIIIGNAVEKNRIERQNSNLYYLHIPTHASVRIPAAGITINQASFKLSSNAVDGPVAPISFTTVDPVGIFFASVLSFSPLSTFEPVNIELQLQLSPRTSLAAGDKLSLLFPGFRGGGTSGEVAADHTGAAWGFRSHLSANASLLHLEITIGADIDLGETFSLTVPATGGISLPMAGVASNTPDITLSTISEVGPVPATSLSSVMGVNALDVIKVNYDPPVPLQQSAITLLLQLTQNFQVGEMITLILPGFSADSREVLLDQHEGFDPIGIWHEGTNEHLLPEEAAALGHECVECQGGKTCFASRVSFTVVEMVPASTLITLRIATGWVRLPSMGLEENEKAVQFRLVTASRALLASGTVAISMRVDALFTNLGLSVLNSFAGRTTSIMISFDVNSLIPAGTSLFVSLPYFGGDEKWQVHCYKDLNSTDCVYFQQHSVYDARYARFVTRVNQAAAPVTSTSVPLSSNSPRQDNSEFTAIWQPKSQILQLTSMSDIQPCRLSVNVPQTSGIRVPLIGLAAGETSIVMSFSVPLLDARTGSVVAINTTDIPVADLSLVQPLFRESSVVFSVHGQPGPRTNPATVSMQIEVTLTAGLSLSDSIDIFLPSFGAPERPESNVNGTSLRLETGSAQFSVEWEPVEHKLVLVSEGTVAPQTYLNLTIPAAWKMSLPANGVHERSGVMIGVQEAASGARWRKAFDTLHVLGVILQPTLTFQPSGGDVGQIQVGAPVALSMQFSLSIPLQTGDSIALMLPGVEGPSQTLDEVVSMHSLMVVAEPLLPSNQSKCRAPRTDLIEGGTALKTVETTECQSVDCSCNWYGPRCDVFCHDLTTCNGRGLCTNQGTCLCFPPAKGPFCNDSIASTDVGDVCQLEADESEESGAVTPRVEISATWLQSPPALRFRVESSAPLAAWALVSYTVPVTAGLLISGNGVPKAEWSATLAPAASPGHVSLLPTVWVRPKCYSSRIIVGESSGSMCKGINPVRICATSSAAAQVQI